MSSTHLFDLSGRVAVVTGCNGGIGRGIGSEGRRHRDRGDHGKRARRTNQNSKHRSLHEDVISAMPDHDRRGTIWVVKRSSECLGDRIHRKFIAHFARAIDFGAGGRDFAREVLRVRAGAAIDAAHRSAWSSGSCRHHNTS